MGDLNAAETRSKRALGQKNLRLFSTWGGSNGGGKSQVELGAGAKKLAFVKKGKGDGKWRNHLARGITSWGHTGETNITFGGQHFKTTDRRGGKGAAGEGEGNPWENTDADKSGATSRTLDGEPSRNPKTPNGENATGQGYGGGGGEV